MASYAKLIRQKAFRRIVPFTDLTNGVLGALVPCLYVLLGRPVPSDVTTLIAEIVVCFAAGALALRLVSAPYFVWKDDQKVIADLKEQLDEPRRKGRAALIEMFREDRGALIKRLMAIHGDLREQNRINRDALETIKTLNPLASPFLIDEAFRKYWLTFEINLRGYHAVCEYSKNYADPPVDVQLKVLNRFSFHIYYVMAAIDGMSTWLAFGDNHAEHFQKMVDEAKKNLREVDFSFAQTRSIGIDFD